MNGDNTFCSRWKWALLIDYLVLMQLYALMGLKSENKFWCFPLGINNTPTSEANERILQHSNRDISKPSLCKEKTKSIFFGKPISKHHLAGDKSIPFFPASDLGCEHMYCYFWFWPGSRSYWLRCLSLTMTCEAWYRLHMVWLHSTCYIKSITLEFIPRRVLAAKKLQLAASIVAPCTWFSTNERWIWSQWHTLRLWLHWSVNLANLVGISFKSFPYGPLLLSIMLSIKGQLMKIPDCVNFSESLQPEWK